MLTMGSTQVSLPHWPEMLLTWVDGSVVVHTGHRPSANALSVVDSATRTGELCVVISSHTVRLLPVMMEELADALAGRLPRGCAGLRLVAWDGGCGHGERPAPATVLASRLNIPVIAPAGPLLGVPGGALFAPAGRGSQRQGGWWRFAPGVAPGRVGWRFPAPPWEADLNELGTLPEGVVVDQVPAGVWLHRPGHYSVTDLVFSVPVDPGCPALIVSHPEERALRCDELGRALAAVPSRAVEHGVLTPYGQHPLADGRCGEVVASVLHHPARVRTGLPLCAPAGQRAVVTVDEAGLPRWRPFVREMQYSPRGAAPCPLDWVNPVPKLLTKPIGPATFALGGGWVAEVIEAGLWLRPERLVDPVDAVRRLPLDADRCAVVIGAPHMSDPVPPARMIATLLQELPADARPRARVLVPYGTVGHVYQVASALSSHLPNPGEVEIIGEHELRVAPEPGAVRVAAPDAATLHIAPEAATLHITPEPGATRVAAPEPPPVHMAVPVSPAPLVHPVPVEFAPEPAPEPVPRREVRSHRNGGDKAGRDREDDHSTTQELRRLLGFFDEIRRARAWDEEDGEQEWPVDNPSGAHPAPAAAGRRPYR